MQQHQDTYNLESFERPRSRRTVYCSHSRFDAMELAMHGMGLFEIYDLMAVEWLNHNTVYHTDREGVSTEYKFEAIK